MNTQKLALVAVTAMLLAACNTGGGPVAPRPSSPAPSATAPQPTPTTPQDVINTPSPSPSESPFSHGPQGLINDLRAAGVDAEEDSTFDGDPISRQGVAVCVEGEIVQVYVFGTPQEAQNAASHIDPRNPSNVGTAIIDWAGEPRFWLRDRIIVLYLGKDEAVQTALLTVLGEPFATGQGGPPLQVPGC